MHLHKTCFLVLICLQLFAQETHKTNFVTENDWCDHARHDLHRAPPADRKMLKGRGKKFQRMTLISEPWTRVSGVIAGIVNVLDVRRNAQLSNLRLG